MTIMSVKALAKKRARPGARPYDIDEHERELDIKDQESPEKQDVFIPREPRDDSDMELDPMMMDVDATRKEMNLPAIKIEINGKKAALKKLARR